MRTTRATLACALAVTALAALTARPARAVEPHRSAHFLPSSNGRSSIAYDATTARVTQFLEHPYRFPQAGQETRNFAFDSYPGLRVGGAGTWLTAVAPTRVEYVAGTGIVHVVRAFAGLTLDEYDFAPMGLAENAGVMLLRATRTAGSGPVDAYALFNFHLGSGGPLPGADAEQIAYSAARDAFYESGPSGVALGYGSIGASSHHGATPQSPYLSLQAAADLADNAGTSGPTNDAVAGLQTSMGDLALNASAWAGWFTVLAPNADAPSAVDRVRTWVNARTSDKLLADEIAAWTAWTTPPPAGASALESALALRAQATLRMGQVTEPGAPAGQILASIAPGKWNIAWVRDMAYATVAFARTGHFAEAKAALAFQMAATTGAYQQYVGVPYQISVVRYFGDGTEESDSNGDGPNVEFDGFGLFLWSLEEYARASGDTATLSTYWPAVTSKVADVLVHLQEPTGLIAADSSIWEVHWNGKQRHFAYTTITAANGLCAAARLADKAADTAHAAAYRLAGGKARDAVLAALRAPDGTIGQSTEALAQASSPDSGGTGWLDAAALEAINFGVIDPMRRTARATLRSLTTGLVPPSGRGLMRSDVGGWYDSQEWVFVDLRAARALALHGDNGASDALFAWNVAQATENFGDLSELHDRVTADYAGESPMVGFGAGAYLIALASRGTPGAPSCDAYANEPADPVDGGADAANDAAVDGASLGDGGADGATPSTSGGSSGGCSCRAGGGGASAPWSLFGLAAVLLIRARAHTRRLVSRRGARRMRGVLFAGAMLFPLSLVGCDASTDNGYHPPPLPTLDGGVDAPPDATVPPVDAAADADTGPCTTTIRYVPPSGRIVATAALTGEWNAFALPGVTMAGPDLDGAFTAKIALAPGLVAYKLLLDGSFELDPGARLQKYVGGVVNSAVRVVDCHVPTLSLAAKTIARAAPGQGHFTATVTFTSGKGGSPIAPASLKASLRKDETSAPLAGVSLAADGTTIAIDAPALADGKYTIAVDASDVAGSAAKTLRLVFWIEAQDFDWRDAVIYMAMTDRFKDGDKTNDPPPTPGVDPRADYQGGDLQGVRAAIANGTLDQLGIRAIWLTPFHTNPKTAWPADDGVHVVTGYHGYWPIKARQVEPRIGGDAALKALVTEAHAHGIRVLQDFVVNHVHQEHEYFAAHPSWFRTGCVCGTANCDWTTHRLDCLFAPYLPDVNWTVPEVNEQYGDDAVWWLDTFDLDGFRIDAVKHVEDVSIINLSARIRDEFEAAGTRVFLTGETAMGWSDCGLACNQDQYDTISRYIGPHGLDGQFDFVLYHAVPYRVFAYDQKGFLHADYWAQASGWEYPRGAIMTPYIGSQDTARFVTLASYRGQDAAHDPSIPGNKWSNIAAAPPDGEPYARHRGALSWLMGLPGAPLIYYGDEYGEWGGADPNNRVMWRGDGVLSADEQTTLARTRALGSARRELMALRRGGYRPVYATETVLVYGRQTEAGDAALVALSRDPLPVTFTAALPLTMPFADGTTLHDRLGGPDVKVSSGAITVTLGARDAAILAP